MIWTTGTRSIIRSYAKKYLVEEGFMEQGLGALDPQPSETDVALYHLAWRIGQLQFRVATAQRDRSH